MSGDNPPPGEETKWKPFISVGETSRQVRRGPWNAQLFPKELSVHPTTQIGMALGRWSYRKKKLAA